MCEYIRQSLVAAHGCKHFWLSISGEKRAVRIPVAVDHTRLAVDHTGLAVARRCAVEQIVWRIRRPADIVILADVNMHLLESQDDIRHKMELQ